MLLSVLRESTSTDPELEIRFIIKNPSVFKLVFKAQKTRKTVLETPKKQAKSIFICECPIQCRRTTVAAVQNDVWGVLFDTFPTSVKYCALIKIET